MTDHERIYSYVVNELSPAEVAEVERHLATCSDCADELSDLQTVTAELSSAVAVSPPARMRSAVLAAVEGAAQASPRSSSARLSVVGEPAVATPTLETSKAPNVVPLPGRSLAARLPALLVAAAVIAALAFGGWAWHEQHVAGTAADQAAGQTAQLVQLLSAKDVKTVPGRTAIPGTAGTVVLSRSRREILMLASDMPALPDGKVYQAWAAATHGTPRSAGTFYPADPETIVKLPQSALKASSILVTVEPSGGSSAPTTHPVFTAHLPGSA